MSLNRSREVGRSGAVTQNGRQPSDLADLAVRTSGLELRATERQRLAHDSDSFEGLFAWEGGEARKARTDRLEEPPNRFQLGLPLVEVEMRRLVDLLVGDVEPRKVEVPGLRHPAERRLLAPDAHPRAVHDPLEDAHVLSVPRPEKVAAAVFAEPIDEKHLGGVDEAGLHGEPVPKIASHVVAAKGEHRERIAPDAAGLAGGP